MSDPRWSDYVRRFHAEHPGITERILGRCRSDGIDPYRWCAEPIHDHNGPVLDIACGSGPMTTHLAGWLGTDCSAEELMSATDRGRGPLVRSAATRLPFAANAAHAVVCSMAMQVIQPVADAIAEVARVLRPGGRGVLLLPATGPLRWRQGFVFLCLQAALRRRIRYPNDRALCTRRLATAAGSHGLTVTEDNRRTFALPLDSERDVEELVRSLYLPGVGTGRLPGRYLRRLARPGPARARASGTCGPGRMHCRRPTHRRSLRHPRGRRVRRHPRRTPRPRAVDTIDRVATRLRAARLVNLPMLRRFNIARAIELAQRAGEAVERGDAGYMLLSATKR